MSCLEGGSHNNLYGGSCHTCWNVQNGDGR